MNKITKAVLETIIYQDIFDFALKGWEIHKWLIGQKATIKQVEIALQTLVQQQTIIEHRGHFVLNGRQKLINKRLKATKLALAMEQRAKRFSWFLKVFPFIKLVGISGSLAWQNVDQQADIDLIIISAPRRIWLSRVLVLCLLSVFRLRRNKGKNGPRVRSKICINTLLENGLIGYDGRSIYLAYETLSLGMTNNWSASYTKYLSDNSWAMKYLPNWLTDQDYKSWKTKNDSQFLSPILDWLNHLAFLGQSWLMSPPLGQEKVLVSGMWFYPDDNHPKTLTAFQQRLAKYGLRFIDSHARSY